MRYAKTPQPTILHNVLSASESHFLINKLANADTSRENRLQLMQQAQSRLNFVRLADLKKQ